ncbi:MAG: hypothetical protein M9932_17730 [Xanthobacteraceae bacterium]|nr:hypothetical protein [Xanthobacteraceae bacterium]
MGLIVRMSGIARAGGKDRHGEPGLQHPPLRLDEGKMRGGIIKKATKAVGTASNQRQEAGLVNWMPLSVSTV